VKLSCAFAYRLTGDAQRIIDVVRVGIRLTRRPKEATEFAIDVTDIRRIEVTIDIEISCAPVLLPANSVREFAQRVQIIRIEERNTLLESESLSAPYLAGNLV